MRYYLIAGEASGDLHASKLMQALKERDSKAEFRFFGGEQMQSQGGVMTRHYKETAVMGFLSVIKNLNKVLDNIRLCEQDIANFRPDLLILVDYPSFNLRIAKYVKEQLGGIKVCYYISPKLWAWKSYRIKDIRKYVDRLYSILPFEVEYFAKQNYSVNYVGNPTAEEIRDLLKEQPQPKALVPNIPLNDRPIIALLPGSRKQEIQGNLKQMISAVKTFPDYQAVIAGAPNIPIEFYKSCMNEDLLPVVFNQTFDLLRQSRAALVTSGTATLETALLRIPQVVCYNLSSVVYYIMRPIIKVEHYSLVNLITGHEVVKELVGPYMRSKNLVKELTPLLQNTEQRKNILAEYEKLWQLLGQDQAAIHCANDITNWLNYSR